MTLRLKLLLIVLSIVLLTALGQGILLRSLTNELERDLGLAVESVSRHLFAVIRFEGPNGRGLATEGVSGDGLEVGLPETSPEARQPVRIKRRIGELSGEQFHEELLDQLDALGVELSEDQKSLIVAGPESGLQVKIPTEGVQGTIQDFGRRLWLGSAGVALLGLLLAAVLAQRLARPLEELAEAAARIGEGELGVLVQARAGGEIGATVEAFNSMSQRLAELEEHTIELRANQHLTELGEIGRGLAHSLRNPLNTLALAIGEIEHLTLESEGQGGRTGGLARDARLQIDRIDRSLRSFLALSAAPIEPAQSDEVDLVDLARDVALEAMQTARQMSDPGLSTAPVRIEVRAERPVAIRGVEAELRAAVQALVVNAVEASPAAGAVEIRVHRQQEAAALVIEDEGPGLPVQVRERLFTPHVTTKASGAGMGLYLAHRIATNRYRGQLTLEAAEGGGTVATLLLRNRAEPEP